MSAKSIPNAPPATELAWLEGLPRRGDVALISEPRPFAHDESQYDAQYGSEAPRPEVGRGVVALMRAWKADFERPALEVGCGTGLVSVGLAEAQAYPVIVLTDPSEAFLGITRRKLERALVDGSRVRYAVLLAEEMARLPAESFSLIVIRSALHHVLDVDRFIHEAARALEHGGVLTFQEPCMEGYVLMGAMAQFIPLVVARDGVVLSEKHRQQIQLFIDAMRFYARRDVDKSQAEDKHIFRVDEIARTGREAGLAVDFLANTVYEECAAGLPATPKPCSFSDFFRDYLKYCMSFDAELVAVFEKHFRPFCELVEGLAMAGNGPYMHGVFVCRKG